MIQLSFMPAFNCSLPATGRKSPRPETISASEAPAAEAAAAAASAFTMLWEPPALSSTCALPIGQAKVKRVANSPRSIACCAFSAVKSAAECTPKVITRRAVATLRQ